MVSGSGWFKAKEISLNKGLYCINDHVMNRIGSTLIAMVCCAVLCCWATSSGALESEPVASEQDAIDTEVSANGVEATIEERNEILDDPFKRSILGDRSQEIRKVLKEWERKLGLEITTSYDALAQGYTDPSDALFGSA